MYQQKVSGMQTFNNLSGIVVHLSPVSLEVVWHCW